MSANHHETDLVVHFLSNHLTEKETNQDSNFALHNSSTYFNFLVRSWGRKFNFEINDLFWWNSEVFINHEAKLLKGPYDNLNTSNDILIIVD